MSRIGIEVSELPSVREMSMHLGMLEWYFAGEDNLLDDLYFAFINGKSPFYLIIDDCSFYASYDERRGSAVHVTIPCIGTREGLRQFVGMGKGDSWDYVESEMNANIDTIKNKMRADLKMNLEEEYQISVGCLTI